MWHDQFPLRPGLVHLNHAGVSPWPRCAHDAVVDFAAENLSQGSRDYPRWLQTETHLRESLARLINAGSADDIALVKSTSEALSFVAYGYPWRAGDNVVHPLHEFPSNRVVWGSLVSRGVEARAVDIRRAEDAEGALIEACDDHTRILAVSAVQYADGFRMDLPRLAAACRRRQILLCVDAIQQLGALPLDVRDMGLDFLAADGHKWLLGPEGLGVFYCRPELRERLDLTQFGWHMLEDMGDFDRLDWRPATTARRFECGSPNMTAVHALAASVDLILETGLAVISENISRKVNYLIEKINEIPGGFLVTRTDPGRLAGIVTFGIAAVDAPCLYRRLMAADVLCAQRAGGVRLSPHFYTPESAMEEAMERVARLSRDCGAR
ncbi:MAG: aminotransferase class V-fold PLP-dependent enzyme [Gammaproteobacteria bacterium]|nr:aminotransferase class V-fold PLP-dependent enzyme [Gammaproteobacteria bacterium]